MPSSKGTCWYPDSANGSACRRRRAPKEGRAPSRVALGTELFHSWSLTRSHPPEGACMPPAPGCFSNRTRSRRPSTRSSPNSPHKSGMACLGRSSHICLFRGRRSPRCFHTNTCPFRGAFYSSRRRKRGAVLSQHKNHVKRRPCGKKVLRVPSGPLHLASLSRKTGKRDATRDSNNTRVK